MYLILAFVLGFLGTLIMGESGASLAGGAYLYYLATIVPSLAVMVRRLHDVGKESWFVVLVFIPLVNLYILYLMFVGSEPGDNKFDPCPK